MKTIVIFLLSLALIAMSCNMLDQKSGNNKGVVDDTSESRIVKEYFEGGRVKSEITVMGNLRHGVTKNYNKNGKLLSEENYVSNKKDGLTVNYYPSGKIHSKLMYKNGQKNGESVWYYENAKSYRITPYEGGKISGIQKYYFENGTLMAEMPYKNGQPGIGLKEYSKTGTLLTMYPEIKFEEINQIFVSDKFTLKIFLSNKSSRVKFYFDNLEDGKYLTESALEIPVKSGVATYDYFVPPGHVKMEKLNIIAEYKTDYGMPYIIRKTYNLALQH